MPAKREETDETLVQRIEESCKESVSFARRDAFALSAECFRVALANARKVKDQATVDRMWALLRETDDETLGLWNAFRAQRLAKFRSNRPVG